jgi:GTP-binding protein YchF
MALKVAIVGLPNVGKSTLFNALTQTASAQAANYPFCTIEPNTGDVAVPEPRLEVLAKIVGSKEIIPARINFVDIAGLVRGASKGEGLGNQFLANIRDCDAIAFVARCFVDTDITHVEGRIDPLSDLEIIETELMLADLESLEKRLPNLEKRAKSGGDKEAALTVSLINAALEQLRAGKPARIAYESGKISKEDTKAWEMPSMSVTSRKALPTRAMNCPRLSQSAPRPTTPTALLSRPKSSRKSPCSMRMSVRSSWRLSASKNLASTA